MLVEHRTPFLFRGDCHPEKTAGGIMSHVPSDPEVTAIESALRALVPSRSTLDRDRLMFRAGQVSARSRSPARWVWPSIAATLTIVAAGEGALLANRPEPRVVERLVIVREPPAPPADGPGPVVILRENPPIPSPDSEPSWPMASDPLRLRRQVLRFGLDALPEPPHLLSLSVEGDRPSGTTSESPGMLRRNEYQKFLNPGGPT
jgi:hypothetical protein